MINKTNSYNPIFFTSDDYQKAWDDCIHKIYYAQPANTDLAYRLMQFAKMKPEELKDLNEIIENDNDDARCFEGHVGAVGELVAMHRELGEIIKGMGKAADGAIAAKQQRHAEPC
tara:strand:- start:135 stop:479 length:345 start_codon:yes stop_codon:yes gene_type:complete